VQEAENVSKLQESAASNQKRLQRRTKRIMSNKSNQMQCAPALGAIANVQVRFGKADMSSSYQLVLSSLTEAHQYE
jgi:hypothetical protein